MTKNVSDPTDLKKAIKVGASWKEPKSCGLERRLLDPSYDYSLGTWVYSVQCTRTHFQAIIGLTIYFSSVKYNLKSAFMQFAGFNVHCT